MSPAHRRLSVQAPCAAVPRLSAGSAANPTARDLSEPAAEAERGERMKPVRGVTLKTQKHSHSLPSFSPWIRTKGSDPGTGGTQNRIILHVPIATLRQLLIVCMFSFFRHPKRTDLCGTHSTCRPIFVMSQRPAKVEGQPGPTGCPLLLVYGSPQAQGVESP